MSVLARKGHLSQKARSALELLTVDPHGLAEPLLLTYGFRRKMLAGLVRTGLATAQHQTVKVRGQAAKVIRIRITDAGRRAIGRFHALT
jgi:hypothetical protein